MRTLLIISSALLLGACGEQAAEPPKAAAIPAKLPAGQYEVTTSVKSLVSTDKTPVPTFTKVGETRTVTGCVSADGVPGVELLATKDDACVVKDPYIRNGRMNLTLDCTRPAQGKVMATLDGKYTADGFTGTQTATSTFAGSGDFRLVEELTARKLADQCSPAATGAAEAKS